MLDRTRSSHQKIPKTRAVMGIPAALYCISAVIVGASIAVALIRIYG